MEQITAKQQAIINAYGRVNFEILKPYININDGFILFRDIDNFESYGFQKNRIQILDAKHIRFKRWRPKILIGLEDNRGWISILSNDDLPKEDGEYKIAYGNYVFPYSASKLEVDVKFSRKQITHYKPILKEQPPIY